MSHISADATRKMIISLADQIIGQTPSREAALEFAISGHTKEVTKFADYMKAAQVAGKDELENTPEVIKAFNEMMWGTALLVAVVAGGSKCVPEEERERAN